jgi:predicted nucleotidyltransferase
MIDIDLLWSDTTDMRPTSPPLLPVFRSRLVGDLLSLLFPDPAKKWTADDLARRTGSPYATVTKELRRLTAAGLLRTETLGRTKLVWADEDNPYFRPLSELVLQSFGPPLVIAEEFEKVEGIADLYIYGSWAARAAGDPGRTPHDVDVLVLGTPDRNDVHDAADRAERRLGREVNTTIRTPQQWNEAKDAFSRNVKSKPMLHVPGPWDAYAPEHAEVAEGRARRGAPARGQASRTRARGR